MGERRQLPSSAYAEAKSLERPMGDLLQRMQERLDSLELRSSRLLGPFTAITGPVVSSSVAPFPLELGAVPQRLDALHVARVEVAVDLTATAADVVLSGLGVPHWQQLPDGRVRLRYLPGLPVNSVVSLWLEGVWYA
jgi:hypothetical protein